MRPVGSPLSRTHAFTGECSRDFRPIYTRPLSARIIRGAIHRAVPDEVGGKEHGLRSHLLRNPEPLEHPREIDAARTLLAVRDRFRGEESLPQRSGRAHVGPRRAFANGDPNPGTCDQRRRPGGEAALSYKLFGEGARENGDVKRLACFNPPFQGVRHVKGDREPMPGRPLELRLQFRNHLSQSDRTEEFYFAGGGRRSLRNEQHHSDEESRRDYSHVHRVFAPACESRSNVSIVSRARWAISSDVD